MFNKKTILATTIFTSVLACAVPAILTNNSTSVSTVARTSASNGTYTDSASEGNNDCTVWFDMDANSFKTDDNATGGTFNFNGSWSVASHFGSMTDYSSGDLHINKHINFADFHKNPTIGFTYGEGSNDFHGSLTYNYSNNTFLLKAVPGSKGTTFNSPFALSNTLQHLLNIEAFVLPCPYSDDALDFLLNLQVESASTDEMGRYEFAEYLLNNPNKQISVNGSIIKMVGGAISYAVYANYIYENDAEGRAYIDFTFFDYATSKKHDYSTYFIMESITDWTFNHK